MQRSVWLIVVIDQQMRASTEAKRFNEKLERIKKRAEEADKRDRETLSPEDLCAIEYLTEHGEFLPDDPRAVIRQYSGLN